jgi:hypothetical protein
MKWPKGELAKEVARLRAITREHAERVGSDPRASSSDQPVIDVAGDPHARGGAILDARSAVLLEGIEVVLIDTKGNEPIAMLMALSGRMNYATDHVTNSYIFGPDGAAGLVSELIGLASRAAGQHGDRNAEDFAAMFKVELERRMGELP